MGAGISYRKGDAPDNAHKYHNEQEDTGSFVPEMMGALTACKENPGDRPLTILVDNASVVSTLARCTFSTRLKDLREHPHRKLCEAVITALHERTAPTIFQKVKAHGGQLLNGQADTEAENVAGMDATLVEHSNHTLTLQRLFLPGTSTKRN